MTQEHITALSISKFLRLPGHTCPENGSGTHVSMNGIKGNFRLPHSSIDSFWDHFLNCPSNEKAKLGIAERPLKFLPVLVDVDLKVREENIPQNLSNSSVVDHDKVEDYPKRVLYGDDEVYTMVRLFQEEIFNIGQGVTAEQLICVILEKPMYKQTTEDAVYVKNGFHLQFPFFFMDKSDIRVHLLARVRKRLTGMFSHLGIDDPKKIVDDASVRNPWLMYGCAKEGGKPYECTEVVSGEWLFEDDSVLDGESKTNECHFLSLTEAFGDTIFYDKEEGEIELKTHDRVQKFLPRILSILQVGKMKGRKVVSLKTNLSAPILESATFTDIVEMSNDLAHLNVEKDLAEARELVKFLSPSRASNYNEWMSVGYVLYNISGGSREALNLWCEWSSQDEKYNETVCIDIWETKIRLRNKPTLGTLIYYAKNDNREKYQEYVNKRQNQRVTNAVNTGGAHNDIAKMLHEMYQTEFRCASIKSKVWYQFRGHIWEPIEEGTYLRAKISDENEGGLLRCFQDQVRHCGQKAASEDDGPTRKMWEERMKGLKNIMKNLKMAPYKNNIMRECSEVFYDRDFTANLNQNPYLVAFKNGVYDLKTHSFRAGVPEDCISERCPINYRTFEKDSEDIQQIEKIMEQMFPDKSVREFFLTVYSEIFVGDNKQKVVLFWTGEGNNGKSMMQIFFEKMLGTLAIKFDTTLLTGKKTGTGTAAPELSRAGPPVRHAVLEEPDRDEQLRCGNLKRLSGSDTYWARDLYEPGKAVREVRPMFTLTFICNGLPEFQSSDKATWNRIRVIPFESEFLTKGYPETYEEQLKQKKFPRDQQFSEKISSWVEPFAFYLLEWRKLQKPWIEPEKVLEATKRYEMLNDKYKVFIDEMVEFGPDEGEEKWFITQSDAFSAMRNWFNACGMSGKMDNKTHTLDAFVKLWGEPDVHNRHKGWFGKRLKTTDLDAQNDYPRENNGDNFGGDGFDDLI
jgi:P4 family phage/plasmid primase-like protien